MQKPQILIKFQKKLQAGQLELPTLPVVTLKIKQAVNNPDQDLLGIAKLANTDPAFCAYLINLANSPMYRGINPSKDVQQALGRIGMKRLRSIVMSYAAKSLFQARDQRLKKWLTRIWMQSVYTASLSSLIAKEVGSFDQEQAMLAGLMLDIGILPILSESSQYDELMGNEQVMMLLIKKYAAVVGEAILTHWGMDKALVAVIKERENWHRRHEQQADLADVVLLGRYHALLRMGAIKNLPKIIELPVLEKLNLGAIGPDQSFVFIHEADREVEAIKASLAA